MQNILGVTERYGLQLILVVIKGCGLQRILGVMGKRLFPFGRGNIVAMSPLSDDPRLARFQPC